MPIPDYTRRPVRDLSSLDKLSGIANQFADLSFRNDLADREANRRARAMRLIQNLQPALENEPDWMKRNVLRTRTAFELENNGMQVDPRMLGFESKPPQKKLMTVKTPTGYSNVEQVEGAFPEGTVPLSETPEKPIPRTEAGVWITPNNEYVPAGTKGAKPYTTQIGKSTQGYLGQFENGKLVPASMKPTTASTESSMTTEANNQVDIFPELTGKPLLEKIKTVPKTGQGDYALVKSIVEGRTAYDKFGSARSPIERERIQKLVMRVDPFFDQYWNTGIGALKKDAVAGKVATQLQGMNQLLGHLEEYKTAYQNLNNKAISVGNTIKNYVAENTGDPDVTAFRTAAKAVQSEGAGVFKTGQGAASPTTEEIKDWEGIVGLANSPEQFNAFGTMMAKLLKSRISAVNSRLSVIKNKPEGFSLLSPKAIESLNGWGVNIDDLTGGNTATPTSKNWWE